MKQGAPIDHFDVRVAEDLEFDVIRTMLAELAGCPSSEKRAESLVPLLELVRCVADCVAWLRAALRGGNRGAKAQDEEDEGRAHDYVAL